MDRRKFYCRVQWSKSQAIKSQLSYGKKNCTQITCASDYNFSKWSVLYVHSSASNALVREELHIRALVPRHSSITSLFISFPMYQDFIIQDELHQLPPPPPPPCRSFPPHTSTVQDKLHHIFNLLQRQSQRLLFPFVAVDPCCHSTGHVAGLDGFVAPVAHCMEEKKGLLAYPHSIVVEHGVGLGSLLPTE